MQQYNLKINGKEYNVSVDSVKGNVAEVTVNGKLYEVEIGDPGTKAEEASVPAPAVSTAPVPTRTPSGIVSPLDGNIISVSVKVGDTVRNGQTVAVLEAMKMENEIQAEADGTVKSVNVEKGDHVAVGTTIITIG